MKNIPSTWCLEPFSNAAQDTIQQVQERGHYVAVLEGVGTVQVQSDNRAKVATLSENNPCILLDLDDNARITTSLYSAPGMQVVQVYRRRK